MSTRIICSDVQYQDLPPLECDTASGRERIKQELAEQLERERVRYMPCEHLLALKAYIPAQGLKFSGYDGEFDCDACSRSMVIE